jgi:predicted enzyme involved in methoxymalonyl-ACP biosynthesis
MKGQMEDIRGVDPFSLTPREVRNAVRDLRRAGIAAEARIAFAGNVVLEPLPEYVEVHLACRGIRASSYITPVDQHLQAILDPASELRKFDPQFLFLHTEPDAILPGLITRRDGTAEPWRRVMTEMLSLVESMVTQAVDNTSATVLLTNFAVPNRYDFGLADWRCELGEQEFAWQLNSLLDKTFRTEARVQILDLCRLLSRHGNERARNRRLHYIAKIPWHQSFLPLLANEITRHVSVSLGEDGPNGARIGPGDPIGHAQERTRPPIS